MRQVYYILKDMAFGMMLLLRRLADVGRRQIFAITDVTQKEQSSGGRFSRETNRNLLLIISDIL
jgi:hypothetical protein